MHPIMRQADFPQRGISAATQPGQWHNYTIMWWDEIAFIRCDSTV
jgi:hypothetical protein